MKRNNAISKKSMPADARRVTNSDGKRVWIIGGKEYPTKREYFDATKKAHE